MENKKDDRIMIKRIEELEYIIINNPHDLNALIELANIYNSNRTGDFYDINKHEEILKRILKQDPDNFMAKNSLEIINIEKEIENVDDMPAFGKKRTIIDSLKPSITNDVIEYVRRPRLLGVIIFIIDLILILAIAGWPIIQPLIFWNKDKQIANIPYYANDNTNIKVNPLTELDGTYKKDVIGQRRRYVEQSMFNSVDYTPSNTVFGGLQDRKPWYGVENIICYDGKKDPKLRANGDSFVSRLINNPSFLIGLDMPYVWDTSEWNGKTYAICKNPRMLFIPQAIYYSPSFNLITAVLDIDNMALHPYEYMLNGLNARDLGYKYGYVYNYTNIRFKDSTYNISKNLYEFQDYLAVGGSCGIEGGCNNICPMQNQLEFYFGDERWHQFDGDKAIIDFKLWKERPISVYTQPDMYYRLLFIKKPRWKED